MTTPTPYQSDTPRTDAVKRLYHSPALNNPSYEYVYADFARQLERELNELKTNPSADLQQIAKQIVEIDFPFDSPAKQMRIERIVNILKGQI